MRSNFDYFSPFRHILWQFFSLESKLPQPPSLTFFPFLRCAPDAAVRAWLLGPRGLPRATHWQWLLTAPSPLSQLLLKENPREVTISSLPAPFFGSWYWVKHSHFLYLKPFYFFQNFVRNKGIKNSKFFFKILYQNMKTSLKHILISFQQEISNCQAPALPGFLLRGKWSSWVTVKLLQKWWCYAL